MTADPIPWPYIERLVQRKLVGAQIGMVRGGRSFRTSPILLLMFRISLFLLVASWFSVAHSEPVRYSFASPVDDLHGWKVIRGEAGFGNGGLGTDKIKDDPHATLLVRSPRFRLEGSSSISLKLQSGGGGPIPTSSLSLPVETVNRGPLGVALRRVTDDAWLIRGRLNRNGPEQEIVFSNQKLKELHDLAPDEVYTIDFFDAAHGGWGHVQLKEIALDVGWVEALPKAPAGFENARPLFLGVLHGRLAFDKKELFATPGSKVSLTLFNSDEMAHNWLICQPGPKVADELGMYVVENLEEMTAADYVPDDSRVLFHSALVAPGNSDTQFLTIPEKKGEYPFVCTFPGHHVVMRGILHVVDTLPLPKDNQVTAAEPVNPYLIEAVQKPVILRGPLQGGTGGHAVVCVGLPGGVSYSFDTYTCAISNVWLAGEGGFIDAKPAWAGRGGKALVIQGKLQHQNPVERKPGEVRFSSYLLQEDGTPVFEFTSGGKTLRVWAEVSGEKLLIHREQGAQEPAVETIELSR